MNVKAAQMVQSCHALLQLVSELKQCILLHDFENLHPSTSFSAKQQIQQNEQSLADLEQTIDDAMNDLYKV